MDFLALCGPADAEVLHSTRTHGKLLQIPTMRSAAPCRIAGKLQLGATGPSALPFGDELGDALARYDFKQSW